MNKYTVYIADKFTKFPLGAVTVTALTKWGAKRKVWKDICNKDDTYIVVASRWGNKYGNQYRKNRNTL